MILLPSQEYGHHRVRIKTTANVIVAILGNSFVFVGLFSQPLMV